jgi:tight adherence protein B
MTALLLAAALCLVTLPSTADARLDALLPHRRPAGARRRTGVPARIAAPAAAGCAAVAVLAIGLALVVAVSAALAAAALVRIVRRTRAARVAASERAGAVEAIGLVAADLRAGQQPAAALAMTADVIGSARARQVLAEAAATARLGGSVPAVIGSDVGDPFRWLGAGWRLSASTGAALATVLEGVTRSGRARLQHERQLAALLAGPRATAVMLAALPVLGLALGAAMGAQPLRVLLHTGAGALALLVGVLLELAGLAWTERIVRAAGVPL